MPFREYQFHNVRQGMHCLFLVYFKNMEMNICREFNGNSHNLL
jgi:hypothetical protein